LSACELVHLGILMPQNSTMMPLGNVFLDITVLIPKDWKANGTKISSNEHNFHILKLLWLVEADVQLNIH